jgi:hypothetical protein
MKSIILSVLLFVQFVSIYPHSLGNDVLPASLLKLGQRVTQDNYELVDGQVKFSSLDQDKPVPLCSGHNRTETRNAVINENLRWYNLGNGKHAVLTIIDSKFSSEHRNNIRRGMNIMQEKLCLEFWVYSNANDLQGWDYAFIHGDNGGCSSWIGRLGQGKQDVTLQGSCVTDIPTIIHELLHLVGLHHEHQRSDRDQYVDILLDNVEPAYQFAFDLLSDSEYTTYGQRYDTTSIMHYNQQAFSKNGQDTIRSKDGRSIGWNKDMTEGDIYKVKQMYNCQ